MGGVLCDSTTTSRNHCSCHSYKGEESAAEGRTLVYKFSYLYTLSCLGELGDNSETILGNFETTQRQLIDIFCTILGQPGYNCGTILGYAWDKFWDNFVSTLRQL